MKRATRQHLVLIAGAIALAALAGWQWHNDQQTDPGTLLSSEPASIQRIDLQLAGAAVEHYAKHDGHWQTLAGAPADNGRLTELTEIAAANVLSWRPASDFDPAKIGLNPPIAILTLDGQRLEFGETAVTGPQRYVRSGNRVALVSVRYTPRPMQSEAKKAQ
ncbi:hypothetical protein SAMN05216570_0831 [Dyella sp. OK004]|uniref:hypothetical protein n=1 Tax=Dyella sp. OK004 TaxID=1855292 RepID=UPI0008EE4374|nr:hypothetical protein [Dyella sp. OK004]SFR93435.1 hypothetical protein SAMN05216570_0831 [Dyella sp. OK004]